MVGFEQNRHQSVAMDKANRMVPKLGGRANEVYHVQKNTVHKKHSQFKKNAV